MMKQNVLAVSILAALGFVTQPSQAAVDLTATNKDNDVMYAQELGESASALTANTGSTFAVDTPLGVGKDPGGNLWVRYELSGGAKWGKNLALSQNITKISGVLSAVGSLYVFDKDKIGSTKISVGGLTGDSHVVYELKFSGAGVSNSEGVSTVLTFNPCGTVGTANCGISIAVATGSTPASITITKATFQTLGDAMAGANALAGTTVTGTLVKFTSSYEIKVITKGEETADVGKEFKEFKTTPVTATLSNIAYQGKTSILANGTAVSITTHSGFKAASSTITFAGNFLYTFSADGKPITSNIQLDSDGSCGDTANGASGVVATDGQTVTFTNISYVANLALCAYKSVSATQISATDYTVSAKLVPEDGYREQSIASLEAGKIKRNGAELQATFVSGVTGGTANRFIFINKCTTEAAITGAKVYKGNAFNTTPDSKSEDATGLTFPLKISANGRAVIQKTQITNLPEGAAAMIFTVGAQNTCVEGSYQLLMAGANVQTVVQMKKPDDAN